MKNSIDFYFDFSSPYGYFSSEKIDELAKRCDCEVVWRPYLMGVVMKITERKPLVQIPMVNEYSSRDLHRLARFHGIEFNVPSTFPVATIAACRAYYWLNQNDTAKSKQLAQSLFRAYFIEDKLISKSDVVINIATEFDIDSTSLSSALNDPDVKNLVREATDDAIAHKVFGSPFFVVGGEPFWGHDRLDQLEAWVKTGGW